MYEAIFFDFDGVLVDSEPVHYECWCEVLADFGIEMSWDVYRENGIGISDRTMLTFLAGLKQPPLDVELLFAEYPRKKQIFRDRMLRRETISREMKLLLDELKQRYRLAVVSSSNSLEVEPILLNEKVHDRFDSIVCGDHVLHLKPAPDPYLLAAERLAVQRALVIEDSAAGEASGRAAGFDVLRVSSHAEVVGSLRSRLGL